MPRMASGKTLPCFAPFDAGARSGGFIGDRFLSGLRPQVRDVLRINVGFEFQICSARPQGYSSVHISLSIGTVSQSTKRHRIREASDVPWMLCGYS